LISILFALNSTEIALISKLRALNRRYFQSIPHIK